MNRKKIIDISIAAVLALGFIIPVSVQISAVTASEGNIYTSILKATNTALNTITHTDGTLQTVNDDLQLNEKFWRAGPFQANGENVVGVFGFCPGEVFVKNPSACAFSVESIQIQGTGEVKAISVDGVVTETEPHDAPTNLLVDASIGTVGANAVVAVGAAAASISGSVTFSGEKPQGMSLTMFLFPSNNFGPTCLGSGGKRTGCPLDAPGWEKVAETIERIQQV